MNALTADTALLMIRIAVGLIVAAHGAQKVFGVFGGPGLERWHGAVASMGFVQPRVLGTLVAFVELFGGLALALGLYTPIVAALLALDMIVATVKVHWSKGFFMANGGYEYTLALLVTFAAIGMHGAPSYSVDQVLGFAFDPVTMFVGVFLIAGAVTAIAGLTHPVPRTRRVA
jgi:putative oxidoreductase